MEISGSYSLSAPRELVWSALLDPDIIKRALPGCESLEQTGAGTYTARLNVDVAQVRGVYDGVARVLETQQPESFRLVVDATGTRGIFHGDGVVQLDAQGADATVVRYSGQAQLGGAIGSIAAQVARGAASMLLKQYFARLANLLPATPVPVPAAAAVSATPEPVSAMPDMAAMPESLPMQQAPASETPPATPHTPASPVMPEAEMLPDTSPIAAPVDALMPPPTAPIAPPAAPPPAAPATPTTAAMSTAAEQTPPKAVLRRARVNDSSIGSERSSARFLGVVIAIAAIVAVALVVWFLVGSLR
jgi:uncharacterized protein